MKNSIRNIIIIVTCAFFILLLFHWKTNYVRKEIAKNDDRIEGIIKKIVHDNIRNNFPSLTIPHIGIDTLFVKATEGDSVINISKIYGDKLTEIEKMVTNYFCDYYRTQDSICKTESLTPFIIYPENKDSQGNIIIQPKDLDNIRNYVLFLEREVDKAVKDTKAELSNDIERLNLWTSIWIAILGIFGAIIPLFSQYQTRNKFIEIKNDISKQEKELKKSYSADKAELQTKIDKIDTKIESASKKADEASDKSKDAIKTLDSLITKTEEQESALKKIDGSLLGIETELKSKSQKINELAGSVDKSIELVEKASTDSEKALTNSTTALKSSEDLKSVVYLSNSLGNLKQLDFYKLHLFHTKMEAYLATVFEKIKNNISDYLRDTDSEVDLLFNELIRDLIISTRQVRNYINQRNQLKNLDALEIALDSLLNASKETIIELSGEVDAKLNNLIDSLKNN